MSYLEGAERFYDLWGAKNDVEFYKELAVAYCGRALELGFGTARLAIQLARAGVETWGIDSSPHMLRAAERNLRREPRTVRDRVHLSIGDARDFDLAQEFGLIYFSSMSFDRLSTRTDQAAALECIRRHLASGGVYAFDLAHVPRVSGDGSWFVQNKELDDGTAVMRLGYQKANPVTRLMSINLWYETYRDGRMIERYHENGLVYVHSRENIEKLLHETGYEILSVFGDHNKNKLQIDSPSWSLSFTRPELSWTNHNGYQCDCLGIIKSRLWFQGEGTVYEDWAIDYRCRG